MHFNFYNVVALKTHHLDFIDIMCPLIIDKDIKRFNSLFNICFVELFANYDTLNVNKERIFFHVIHYVHCNEHHDPKNY